MVECLSVFFLDMLLKDRSCRGSVIWKCVFFSWDFRSSAVRVHAQWWTWGICLLATRVCPRRLTNTTACTKQLGEFTRCEYIFKCTKPIQISSICINLLSSWEWQERSWHEDHCQCCLLWCSLQLVCSHQVTTQQPDTCNLWFKSQFQSLGLSGVL